MSDLKAALLKTRLPQKVVELPNVGEITIRALSRQEVKDLQGDDLNLIEQKIIAAAVLDPVLTLDEVKQWAEASAAGEIEYVSEEIMKLSGLGEGAYREAVHTFRDGSDS